VLANIRLIAEQDTLVFKAKTVEVEESHAEQSKILSHLNFHRIEISQMDHLNFSTVTDIVKYFPDVFIKDYGGFGGIKTISLRGTASSQTQILLDGVPISSSQNSVVDFSSLPLTYFESIDVIANGSSSLFGANSLGGTINLHSKIPEAKSINLASSFGSFDYFNFSIDANSKIFKIPYFISLNYLNSSGNYPFEYNDFGKLTTIKRNNGDISSLNANLGIEIQMNKSLVSSKLFLTNSARGVPGAVLLGKIENSSASLNESKILYLTNLYTKIDTNRNNELKFLFSYNLSDYNDEEILLNNGFSNSFFISRDLRIIEDYTINSNKISQNISLNLLYSNLSGSKLSNDVNNYVERMNLGIGYDIIYDLYKNESKSLSSLLSAKYDYWSDIKNILSYSAGLDFRNIILNTDLKLIYSYNYRIPNFNEMYYLNYGTVNLLPEKSNSYSLSLDIFPYKFLKINANTYFINTKDQIISVPKSPISWSAQNIGTVYNYGISTNIQLSLFHNTLTSMLSYTYQQSIDKTANSPSFNKLIPYLPEEIISFLINYSYSRFAIGATLYYNSFRYYMIDNSLSSIMEKYYTIDINLSMKTKILSNDLNISFIIKNITDQYYEIIKNYPMPKRSFVFSASYNVK